MKAVVKVMQILEHTYLSKPPSCVDANLLSKVGGAKVHPTLNLIGFKVLYLIFLSHTGNVWAFETCKCSKHLFHN
jgi:hypothetical protein